MKWWWTKPCYLRTCCICSWTKCFFLRVNLKFMILFNPLRAKRRMKSLSPELDGHGRWGDVGYLLCIPLFLQVWSRHVERSFESPKLFCMIWMSTYKQKGCIHVSENHNEALGINNLRASYWPHLFSFSAVCFHLWLTVIIDHVGFKVLMVHDYCEVG